MKTFVHENIEVKIIADSIGKYNGKRITTFQLDYPRMAHAEILTHRVFSRNAASSRAIPVASMIELIKTNPAHPIHWGKNQSGMQAQEELEQPSKIRVQSLWQEAAENAASIAEKMLAEGAHKQIVNRILEPFQIIRVLVTSTEFDNFFYLRYHKDAFPEIAKLAELMYKSYTESEPELLSPGEWHTPFVSHERDADGNLSYFVEEISLANAQSYKYLTLDEALKISSSCCAQVSYRKADTSLEKALSIYDKLITMKPCHASPLEHQATPVNGEIWPEGVTHQDCNGYPWSGNFKQWIQYRQLIPDNVCNNFVEEPT